MANLANKKVLFFVPRAKGIYGTGISRELERLGAIVTVYDERPSTSPISKIALRIAKRLLEPYLLSYFNKIINQNKNIDFDFVFVIRGEGLTFRIAKRLRMAFPDARFILYLWDSIKNNNTKAVFPYFDKILSFDQEDVVNHPSLIFRPLFFLPDYRKIANAQPRPIDILFIGTVHSDRFSFINNLQSFFKDSGISTFFYFFFPSKLLYWKKKLTDPAFKGSKIKDFNYKMLTTDQASSYMSQSKASLDVEGPGQTGLTMRTIEVLGAKRKLVTTNQTVKSYDFYNECNILVVDRFKPEINPLFIYSPYVEVNSKVYERYSVEGWIEEIFS